MKGKVFLFGAAAVVFLVLSALGLILTRAIEEEGKDCTAESPEPAICERSEAAARSSLIVSIVVGAAGIVSGTVALLLQKVSLPRGSDGPSAP